jgi:hypothetical protein
MAMTEQRLGAAPPRAARRIEIVPVRAPAAPKA